MENIITNEAQSGLGRLNNLKEEVERFLEYHAESISDCESIGFYSFGCVDDENDLAFYGDGVFCSWCDSYFSSQDDAIEVLKEDRNAINAAFNGLIEFEECAYIENLYNGETTNVGDYFNSFHDDCCELFSTLKGFNLELSGFSVIVDIIDGLILDAEVEELENVTQESQITIKTKSI